MIEQVERLWRRLQTVVGRGRITLVDDSASAQRVQARTSAISVPDGLPRLAEYGFQSNPPPGADAVVLFLAGNASDGVVIATGHQTWRMRGLASGEVAISDNAGQRVYLSAAGIRIEGGSLPIQINTTGGLAINADTVFTGTVHANGKRIDDQHHHVNDSRGDVQGVVA